MPVLSLSGDVRAAVVVVPILLLLFIFGYARRGVSRLDRMNGAYVTRQVARVKLSPTPGEAEDVNSARVGLGPESADMGSNQSSSYQASSRFTRLAADPAAQRLLQSMRQDSERIRRKRANQIPIVVPTPGRSDSEARRLRQEVETLRRENEMFRYLQSQAVLATTAPDDAPPPYTPRDEPPQS